MKKAVLTLVMLAVCTLAFGMDGSILYLDEFSFLYK